MATKLAVMLTSVRSGVARSGIPGAAVGRTGAAVRAIASCGGAGVVARGPDRPGDLPGRHPDIYPPAYPHDSPRPDPGNPDPDLYPPDVGTPRRDPDVVPPRYPSPDIFPPPTDNPDMPEPPLPGKGPFMAALLAHSRTNQCTGGLRTSQPALLLKTDGGNPWLEARRALSCGLHTSAVARWAGGGRSSEEHPGRGMSEKEQEAANQTSAAKEGEPLQEDGTPMSAASAAQGALQPEETGHSADVPKATATRFDVDHQVGPKAKVGVPPEVPTEVPRPGFPNTDH